MKAPLLARTRIAARHASPLAALKRVSTAKVMRQFADKHGLVYFGVVDQVDDEHRLVRGITASTSQRDHHYTVGTFKSYDISFVLRRDMIVYRDRRVRDHTWTILTIDLHVEKELSPLFLGHHSVREMMLAKYSTLSELPLSSDPALQKFVAGYALYGQLAHEYETYELITVPLLQAYAEHAGMMSVEVTDGTVYVYFAEKHPTWPQLDRMLNFGIWMAEAIDLRIRQLSA